MARRRYNDFVEHIDIDALEEDLGFEVLARQGDNDTGYCFDIWGMHQHGDTTGKMAIHRTKKVYNCWVCGGGSLLDLVMNLKDYDADEAIDYLYQFAHGDKRDDQEFLDDFIEAFQDAEERVKSLPYFNPQVLERFKDETDWFNQQGISPLTCNALTLRFGAKVRKPSPKVGKFADDEDYHGPAVIIPHWWKDRLVGWQHRWLDEDRPQWVGKYTNTPDFPKENTIYNYDLSLHEMRGTGDPVVVAESPKTVARLMSCGFSAVATFGSSLNPAQLRLLRRIQAGVVLAPDNDDAGKKWLREASEYLERYIQVYHLPPVEGEKADLADLNDDDLYDHLEKAYDPALAGM